MKLSDLLSRTQRSAVDLEAHRERRSAAEKFHFADSRADHDKVARKHAKIVRVPAEVQVRGGIHPRLLSTPLHAGLVSTRVSYEKVSRALRLFAIFLQAKRFR